MMRLSLRTSGFMFRLLCADTVTGRYVAALPGPALGLWESPVLNTHVTTPCSVSAASLCPGFGSRVKGKASCWPRPSSLDGWPVPQQRNSWLWPRVQHPADDSAGGRALEPVSVSPCGRSGHLLTEGDSTESRARRKRGARVD